VKRPAQGREQGAARSFVLPWRDVGEAVDPLRLDRREHADRLRRTRSERGIREWPRLPRTLGAVGSACVALALGIGVAGRGVSHVVRR